MLKGTMKHLHELFINVVVLLCASTSFAWACTNNVAIVAGKTEYPPLSWNKQGKLDGIAYKIIAQILKEKEISTQVHPPIPWKRSLQQTEAGNIDILVTVRETATRTSEFAFVNTPMLKTAQNVFYLKNDRINKKEDLIGKIGGVTLGVKFDGEFNQFATKHLTFHEVARLEQNISKLETGRIHYFISPLLSTLHFMNIEKLSGDITYLPRPLFATSEKVAISKKSSCLQHLDYIDQRLAEMEKDGVIDKLLEEEFMSWTNLSSIIERVSPSTN